RVARAGGARAARARAGRRQPGRWFEVSPAMNRAARAELARETVEILRAGRYVAPSGAPVDLTEAIAAAVDGTVEYGPRSPLPPVQARHAETVVTVANETTLAAAHRLVAAGWS